MTDWERQRRITLERGIAVLKNHEWAYKEDLKNVYCATCGKQHRDSSKSRTHRPNCEFVAMLAAMEELLDQHRPN